VKTVVFMFPGQSSRYPEMFERLLARPVAAAVVAEASEALNRDLRAHYRPDNASQFDRNRDVQVGVFVANHAYLKLLESAGARAHFSLGMSLGEYNHLVHIGALSFADAVRLVDTRGNAYDEGPEGSMVAVFPFPLDELEPIVERARSKGPIVIANINSPTQNVIAGSRVALDAAVAELEEQGCECVLIEPKIPMHAPIFKPVADRLRSVLEAAPWKRPTLPYLPNVEGKLEREPSAERIAELLGRHVHQPVLWRASIDALAADPHTIFVEVGPRAVLYNLFGRSWHKNPRFKTDADEHHFAALVEELAHAA
jgi:[acyl-carrier-protein] S-malonyltransferase